MMGALVSSLVRWPAASLFAAWLAIVLLLLALFALLWRVHRFVSKPQRIRCPQCGGNGSIGKPHAGTKARCPYCAGSKVVWR